MTEHRKIVVEHYPVDRLPLELQAGLEAVSTVRVTVEAAEVAHDRLPPLASYIGKAKGLNASPEDVLTYIRELRNEWE